MKKITTLLSLIIFFSCNNSKNESVNTATAVDKAAEMTNGATTEKTSEATAVKKYDIKSGIITYETSMSMSGMNIKTKKILYFDDFGSKECEEEYKIDPTGKEVLANRNFVKDGFHYICSIENNGGVKTKERGTGVAAAFNMEEASSMKDSQFKKTADETVCGKACNSFSMVTPSGNIKMFGWNKITLKTVTDNASMQMKSEQVATKVEENASIPADKFEVPAGMKITDM
jgi:hypothetical protein